MPYPDERFARQLERQLEQHGARSIFKTRNSLMRQLAEHRDKFPGLQYRKSVEREIQTFERQLETVDQFIADRQLGRNGARQ